MKKILMKVYARISLVPFTLLVFVGGYEMLFGDMLRGIMDGNVSWVLSVTDSMIIDTVITIVIVYYLVNGFSEHYKKMCEKRKSLSTMVMAGSLSMAFALFVIGKFFMGTVRFKINYPIFMLVLLAICILQKIMSEVLNLAGKDKKGNHQNISV